MGCHSLLQGIFPTQGWNPGLLHSRWILYHLNHWESPTVLEWGGGEDLLCLSCVDIMLPLSASPPGWAGELPCAYMVKLGPQVVVFHMCREHALGSLAR